MMCVQGFCIRQPGDSVSYDNKCRTAFRGYGYLRRCKTGTTTESSSTLIRIKASVNDVSAASSPHMLTHAPFLWAFSLDICVDVKQELKEHNINYSENVEIGIMVDTPASALISDRLAPMVDFLCICTIKLAKRLIIFFI